ncbi:MAG: nicotinate-nucleotide adenylyltransferase [Coprobacillus sp.]
MIKIGLFGGSFDPIHKAHIYIAKFALEQLNLDEVHFIPTKNNPWKDASFATSKQRIEMIHIAIKDYDYLKINTIEIDSLKDDKNFTIDTIKQLMKDHPNTEYYYIMGVDQANSFYKWKDAKEINKLLQLVAFQRGGYKKDEIKFNEFNFIELLNEPINASSSDARDGHIEMLEHDVLKYMTNHGLYLETMIASKMSEKRWKHTCSVAKLAYEIAEANHLDSMKAYVAGMFHDIAKEMSLDETLAIMNNHFKEFIDKPQPILHQWVSRYITEIVYLIDDEEILKAIEQHTTASIHISQIGKCVYVADKLDPLRDYDSSEQILICKKDINEGFRNSLIDFYEFSKKKNRDIDKCFYDIYNYFVEKGEI